MWFMFPLQLTGRHPNSVQFGAGMKSVADWADLLRRSFDEGGTFYDLGAVSGGGIAP
jgi:hypothetical protein